MKYLILLLTLTSCASTPKPVPITPPKENSLDCNKTCDHINFGIRYMCGGFAYWHGHLSCLCVPSNDPLWQEWRKDTGGCK